MYRKTKGFTLVELMVTIAVAAILLTVGVPSLTSVYEGIRVNNNVDKINGVLAFARNQAISYGVTVNVCAYGSATSCGTNWANGVRVFITDASNTDHELRTIDGFNSQDVVKGPTTLSFSSEGLSSSGTLIYCPSGKTNESKSVRVSSSGLITYSSNSLACS